MINPEIAQAHRELDRLGTDQELLGNDVTAMRLELRARIGFESGPELERRFKPEFVKVLEKDFELTERHLAIQGQLIQILERRGDCAESIREEMRMNEDHASDLRSQLVSLSLD